MGASGSNVVIILVLVALAALVVAALWKRRGDRFLSQSNNQRDLISEGENLRRIFESIQDYAIFSYNRDRIITSWNPGVQRVLGYTQDEFIGKKIDIIFDEPDLKAGIPAIEIERALADGFSITEGIRVRKNGRRFWGSGMVRPLYNERGKIEGLIKVLQDLTGRRELEESLEQAKRIAEEANRAKDEFIAVLSHELRSPLTPITIAIDGLEMEVTTDNGRMFLDMIRRNLALELRLIDDLLDVTRITRGKLAIKLENVDAHVKIAETVEMLRHDIEERRLILRLHLLASSHHVLADPARFQQIVWNLLRNAIKFTPENGVITISTKSENGQIVIEVCDTGIGMDRETLERIFRPFTQGMPNIARKYGGLGLGLTIARALTETFAGSLTAHSEGPGKGTTFKIELPLIENGDYPAAQTHTNGKARPRRRASLLVVDDQEDARIALCGLLGHRGYKVDTAENITDAVNLVRKNNYDLILCDIQLQGESGWDLMTKLPRPIPAIAVTALGTPSNIERSFQAGFRNHIIKPFRLNDLDSEIQEVLNETQPVGA